MLKIRQIFCDHDYEIIARHKTDKIILRQCEKCDLFHIHHYDMGISYECKIPNVLGWEKADSTDL